MKSFYNIPILLCHHVVKEKLFSEFAAYLKLQMESDGIMDYNVAMNSISGIEKLTTTKSRKKCFLSLQKLGWIGYDSKMKKIYLRSICGLYRVNDTNAIRVALLKQKDVAKSKSFAYAAILSEKLQQQKSAIFLQIRKKSAAKKSDAALQTLYCGLGKFGLASLFHCSPSQAVKIKERLRKDGYLLTKKCRVKVLTIPKPDMNIYNYLNESFPDDSAKMTFARNKNGGIDVFKQLHDKMQSKLCVKKRKAVFNGIRKMNVV